MKKNSLLLLLLFVSLSIFLLNFFYIETDYFWHIKAGEYMFKNGIITHDVFSWFMSGKYWISHEWLFEIIIYSLKNLFGNIHSIVYSFICLISLFSILFFTNKKNIIKNISYTLIYLCFLALLSINFIEVRPHMISNVFVCLSIYLLYDLYKNNDSKKIYILPLITILWSNIHGGSSNLSYILCFIFFICGLFSFKFKKIESNRISKKQLYRYLLVMALCMIGACINIHGFKMFIYPYTNILDNTMINTISEWGSTSLGNIRHYPYFIFIVFIIITMITSEKKIQLIDFILLCVCLYLGLKSVRFWLYSPIIMYYFIFEYVKERKPDRNTGLILGIASVLLLGLFIYSHINYNLIYKYNLDDEVINTIKKENPNRLFNMYDYGGELIYNNIPVFIDGRADLYSNYNYKDYLNITNCINYNELINKYDFDYLLIDKNYPIYYCIEKDIYEVIYENNKLILYKKTVN